MPYIGKQLVRGQNRKLDDISSGFNGSQTTFTLQIASQNVSVGSALQLWISVGGVIQNPLTDFTIAGNQITFTTAPAASLDFFGVIQGDVTDTNTPGDATVTTSKLATGLTVNLADGSAATSSLQLGGTDSGLFSSAADKVNVTTGGVERLEIGSSEVVFNDGSNDVDFRVESNGQTHMLFVDGGNDRVGVGTAAPSQNLHVENTSGVAGLLIEGSNLAQIILSDNNGGTNDKNVVLRNSQQNLLFGTQDDSFSSFSESLRLDSSGRLLVGTSTARANFNDGTDSSHIQLEGTTQNTSTISNVRNSNNDGPSHLVLGKSRGAGANSSTIVQSGDTIGHINFEGADGTHLIRAAQISALVDGTPGANDMPGRLVFSTCADGAASLTERMRLISTGVLKVSSDGTYMSATAPFHEFNSTHSNEYAFRVKHKGTTNQQFGIRVETTDDQNDSTRLFLSCVGNNTTRAAIRSNGGLANYQSNNANLCDEREKKNIVILDTKWDKVKSWELKKFHYHEDADTDDKRYGVIAQQVEEHCPEVLTDWSKQAAEDAVLDEDGNVVTPAVPEILRKGVKEQQMMWMAIKALQEAQARIETLETKVAALEAG